MPTVGSGKGAKHFSYGVAGEKAAKAEAKRTGRKILVKKARGHKAKKGGKSPMEFGGY